MTMLDMRWSAIIAIHCQEAGKEEELMLCLGEGHVGCEWQI